MATILVFENDRERAQMCACVSHDFENQELLEFNSLVISKGLREDAGPGFEVWCSDDVQHYDLKTA